MIYILSLMYLISSSMLQYVHHLQRKYSLGSFNLLGHTAPAQAASLLVLGPFVDFWLTNKRVDTFNYTSIVTVSDAYSGSVLLISSQNCFMRKPIYFSTATLFFWHQFTDIFTIHEEPIYFSTARRRKTLDMVQKYMFEHKFDCTKPYIFKVRVISKKFSRQDTMSMCPI